MGRDGRSQGLGNVVSLAMVVCENVIAAETGNHRRVSSTGMIVFNLCF